MASFAAWTAPVAGTGFVVAIVIPEYMTFAAGSVS